MLFSRSFFQVSTHIFLIQALLFEIVTYIFLEGEEDATAINWMILKKGPAQRCECGNFFQLVTGTAYDLPSEH